MPHRGYLDNLATRSLSSGTNAYTTEDHTAYQITTAGSEGMMNVFPIFMDHILNPTLTPSQYVTEVYHLDGNASHQGVVYCEMASREQTDSDIVISLILLSNTNDISLILLKCNLLRSSLNYTIL